MSQDQTLNDGENPQVIKGENTSEGILNENLEGKDDKIIAVDLEESDEPKKDDNDSVILDDETHLSSASYEDHDLKALIPLAQDSLVQTPLKALEILRDIRAAFYDKFNVLKKEAISDYLESNENLDEFSFELEPLVDKLNEIITKANEARREEKKRIEEEKQSNLKKKRDLITKLEAIVSNDETEESIAAVRQIQKEWRAIKALPHSEVQPLWEKFTFLMDKFYDTHSINIELKELDRKKNLEAKIELVKKMSELHQEKSLKKSFVLLRKYHDDFKNFGPVPAESREGLWQAFKAESDAVYDAKKAELQVLDAEKEENLKHKELLIEKISLIAPLNYSNQNEWKEKSEEIENLFQDWKKIGIVPKTKSDEVWNTFRSFRNTFYNNKKQFFGEIAKKNTANLLLKEDLCKQVEALLEDENLEQTTKEIIKIQGLWKEIHTINNKESNALWKRFRQACDTFFNKKKALYADRDHQELENYNQKRSIIEKLVQLKEAELQDDGFAKLKALTDQWRSIGFVPRKKMKVNEKYDQLCDELFAKYRKNREGMKSEMAKEHYSQILSLPKGASRLQMEEQKLKQKIKFVQDEIAQMENNMSFFALSKGAQTLFKDIEAKIEKSKGQLERLKIDLKSLKKTVKESQEVKEEPSEKSE